MGFSTIEMISILEVGDVANSADEHNTYTVVREEAGAFMMNGKPLELNTFIMNLDWSIIEIYDFASAWQLRNEGKRIKSMVTWAVYGQEDNRISPREINGGWTVLED